MIKTVGARWQCELMTDTWLPSPVSSATVLGVLRETVGDLADALWAARAPEELLETLRQIERLRSALDAVQLQVVAELDATDGVKVEGWGSTQDFLTAVTGGRKGAGKTTVPWLRRSLRTGWRSGRRWRRGESPGRRPR